MLSVPLIHLIRAAFLGGFPAMCSSLFHCSQQ